MATHRIEPVRDTLHGTFSREYPPLLTIDSGDTVLFRTLHSGWALEPPSYRQGNVKEFEPRLKGRDDGHALCGPIAIRGAQPGMALEIDRKSTRLNSSHQIISYAVFCLKKKSARLMAGSIREITSVAGQT